MALQQCVVFSGSGKTIVHSSRKPVHVRVCVRGRGGWGGVVCELGWRKFLCFGMRLPRGRPVDKGSRGRRRDIEIQKERESRGL